MAIWHISALRRSISSAHRHRQSPVQRQVRPVALLLFSEDRSFGLAWASPSPAAWERAGAAVVSLTPGYNWFLGATLSLRLSNRGRSRLSRRTARRPKDAHGAAVWVAGVSWPDPFLTAERHAQAAG